MVYSFQTTHYSYHKNSNLNKLTIMSTYPTEYTSPELVFTLVNLLINKLYNQKSNSVMDPATYFKEICL